MADLNKPLHIALVSMPWSLFNRPSIQLGSLKAFIEKNIDISVDCYHPYLGAARTIGVDTYSYISKNSWAGEAIFSAILFPERKDQAKSLFEKACSDNRKIGENFDNICEALNSFLADWVNSIDFSGYGLTGFSVCFSQLFSSLAAAQKIKRQCANAPIIFGGSSCLGKMGQSLCENFPQVDHVIEGEGKSSSLTCAAMFTKPSLSEPLLKNCRTPLNIKIRPLQLISLQFRLRIISHISMNWSGFFQENRLARNSL